MGSGTTRWYTLVKKKQLKLSRIVWWSMIVQWVGTLPSKWFTLLKHDPLDCKKRHGLLVWDNVESLNHGSIGGRGNIWNTPVWYVSNVPEAFWNMSFLHQWKGFAHFFATESRESWHHGWLIHNLEIEQPWFGEAAVDGGKACTSWDVYMYMTL